MKELSISEFINYISKKDIKEYIYATKNQNREYTAMIVARFKDIKVCLSPNMIVFVSGKNSMSFPCVKRIILHENIGSVGIKFDVICRGKRFMDSDQSFTFIAD